MSFVFDFKVLIPIPNIHCANNSVSSNNSSFLSLIDLLLSFFKHTFDSFQYLSHPFSQAQLFPCHFLKNLYVRCKCAIHGVLPI